MPVNQKTTELTENTSRHFNDIFAMVDDPTGTPLSQYIKFINATGFIVNAQTGTTYTYLTGDYGKLVTHTNGSAIAATLPQAGASFPANWFMLVQNRGAGAVTITPTTSTIDGAATLVLNQNEGAIIVSDGTNYFTLRGKATGAAGVGDFVGPASSVDAEFVLFDGTTGKLGKRATGSGFVKATSGVYSTEANPTTGLPFELVVACSDLTTALTTGTAKNTFPWPIGVTLTSVHAFLVTPQTSGSIFTVDVNEGGVSILSTKITIDNGESSSTTAVTAPVLSDTSLAAMASITVDIDQVGDGTAKGLYLVFVGTRT